MTIDRRTLNLLGLLVIVAVFGLGALLFAKPMLDGVMAANQQIRTTEETNQQYQMKLSALVTAEKDRAQLERQLAELRTELPATPDTGSMLQVIEAALAAQGLQIESYSVGESFDFAPRVDPNADEEAAQAAPAETSAPAPEDAAAEATATADATATDAAAAPEVAPTEPRQQIEVTLEIEVPDEAAATAFLDALQAGPRLLLVTAATTQAPTAGESGSLSVTLQVFYRTEAAR